jgi:hypothetical protein
MDCDTRIYCGHGAMVHQRRASCCCAGQPVHGPCFPTREERAAHLEAYLEQLRQTVQHVEDCLARTKEEE